MEFLRNRSEKGVARKSCDPEFTPHSSEHVNEGRPLFVSIPGRLASHSCHVLLTIAIVQIPHNDDAVGSKGHRQRMEDRFFSLATSRIGTGFLVRVTASRFATPPSVLRVVYAHGLLDVSECDLDFPPPSKLNQDRRSRLFVIGAEKGAVTRQQIAQLLHL